MAWEGKPREHQSQEMQKAVWVPVTRSEPFPPCQNSLVIFSRQLIKLLPSLFSF
jgi:hypothetical protein